MTIDEARITFGEEIRTFMESEAGTHFRINLSKMRPQGSVIPIPGVDYGQLCAAEQKMREGYELCITNMNILATQPPQPEKVRPVKYNKKRTKS